MLEKKVLNTIQKYELIKYGDNIVVGVSGGPDSMTLLNVLCSLKETLQIHLFVAHINHQIRKEAKQDEEYVKDFCAAHQIPFFVLEKDVMQLAKEQKIGTEEAGRKVRYDFFEEICKKVNASKIATAHTANDQAETILMNLMRGSGTNGLKGIQVKRGKYIRPLLEITRQEIEQYCQKQQLNPRIDQTNQENVYTRNRIRNELIPYIEKNFNPSIVTSLNRLSEIVKEQEEYMEKVVEKAYLEIMLEQNGEKIVLDLKKFTSLEIVIKKRILLYTITKLFGTSQGIERIHIEDMLKLCENNIGNKYLIPNKKMKILVKNKKIILSVNS
ncbi:MAG: tRNA lysidine(34) synthetase TilS [Clostridia bacterium]